MKNRGETIPADDLPLIFDRFHKSDRSRSLDRDGVGLGLYLVKSILDAHNEDIAVTSRDGVTDFVFTLTLAREPKQKAEPRKKPEQRKKPEPRKKAGQEHKTMRQIGTGLEGFEPLTSRMRTERSPN